MNAAWWVAQARATAEKLRLDGMHEGAATLEAFASQIENETERLRTVQHAAQGGDPA